MKVIDGNNPNEILAAILRNPGVYKKRKNWMDLRTKAADALDALTAEVTRYRALFEAADEWQDAMFGPERASIAKICSVEHALCLRIVQIKSPDDYYYLKAGEIIQQGDEVDACVDGWRDDPKWIPAVGRIGQSAPDPRFPSHSRYRRRIATVSGNPTPEQGDMIGVPAFLRTYDDPSQKPRRGSVSDDSSQCHVDDAPELPGIENAKGLRQANKIELYCIQCESRTTVDRQEDDPPNAVLAHIQCPECVGGDFDSTEYFDKEGSQIPYETTADSSQKVCGECHGTGKTVINWAMDTAPCPACADQRPTEDGQ